MADRLVIEIDGNASGLTKALSQAQSRLTLFNTNIANGNKALTGFLSKVNTSAAGLQRLGASASSARSGLNNLSTAIARVTKEASAASSQLRGFGTALGGATKRLEGLSAASKGASTSMTSLNRRLAALGATVSLTNTQMRSFMRTMTGATGTMRGGTTIINNYGRGIGGLGNTVNRSTGLFNRLNRANITLMEGFRRHVAQITALRTLTYQAIFWFGPLVYSIIKVNANYEKQMQLLKNLSGATTEYAKTQYALQTRAKLVGLANTNPFSLDQITRSFVRMKVSGLDPLNGSLQTLMDSIAAFGGGNDELERAGIALQQMVGKSAVSMEELRQQLGEHIPDAMKAMAQGMGVSMAKFYKAVQSGTVEATTAIHNMLVVLNEDHRGAARAMMNTWNGLMARLGTAWQNFVARLEHSDGRNTFIDTLKQKVGELMVFLNSPAGNNLFISIEQGLATVIKTVSNAIRIIYEWRNEIITAAKIFAVLWGGRLVLGTLMSVTRLFLGGLRGIIVVMRLFTSGAAASRLMTMKFSRAIRELAVSLGIARNASTAAAMGIGAIAASMATAVGIALALAAAIWMVVRALNAKTTAQANQDLIKDAKEGKAFDSPEQQNAERARLTELKRKAETGYTVNLSGAPTRYTKAQRQQFLKEYNEGVQGFNLKLQNTKNARIAMVDVQFDQAQPDPYAGTRSKYADAIGKIDVNDPSSGSKIHDLREKEGKELAQNAQSEIERLTALKANPDYQTPELQHAINDRLKTISADKESFLQGFVEQKYIAGNKKGKKKKQDHTLENLQTKYQNAFVGTEDLEHQYDDLKNSTDTEFDTEAAQEQAKQNMRGKTIQQLRDMIEAEKVRREEIKKSILVEKAIIDVEQTANRTRDEALEQLENLEKGYDSIDLASEHYRNSLLREHDDEIRIAKARMESGKATKDQIRQYKELMTAIIDATRAKEFELLVEQAKESKSNIDEFEARYRSPLQQYNYQADLRRLQLMENIRAVQNDLLKYDQEMAELRGQASDAQAALDDAQASSDQTAIDAAKNDIVVTAQRISKREELHDLYVRTLPFFERELQLSEQEAAIRNKYGGAGGPLFDWALPASQAMTDLGKSVGELFAGQMDSFIESLAEGKMAFADFAKSIIKGIIAIIIKGVIAKAILSALGFAGGGSVGLEGSAADMTYNDFGLGSVSAGGGHTGMVVGGTARFHRSVSPAMFGFASRYHTGGIVGLRPNEVPIIAERGEGVFTKEQMKALGGAGQGSNVQVNVINQTGVDADVKRSQPQFDGEKWVETIILKKMASPGPVRDGISALGKR